MLENISQLKAVDKQWLDQIVQEITAPAVQLESLWREPYPEYGSAGLKVATLLNPTGEQENFDYRDCRNPQVTPLLQKLPTLQKFLLEGKLDVMGARLLRLDPGTFLHEHRDFVYLEPVPRYRLHLPLITNDQAFITSPGLNVHFERGYLWKLNPKQTVHSACNFGSAPRIHLMLDCYVNDTLAAMLKEQFLDERNKHVLAPFTAAIKEQLMQEAKNLLAESTRGNASLVTAAEELLLKTFCLYDLRAAAPGLTTYDLLFELFDSPVFAERTSYWKERLVEVYPPLDPLQKEEGELALQR
ncbi:MAG: aspartyl/asparaginyl beta-hydroxylase domain-containing protein [Cyanobacteria bacterium SZAS TMP-1]|nr:aspartyl/asparaginyl beta-hydroxylase domain-containing protein [Cyanobacteria bacterium SZAS TMP-1]